MKLRTAVRAAGPKKRSKTINSPEKKNIKQIFFDYWNGSLRLPFPFFWEPGVNFTLCLWGTKQTYSALGSFPWSLIKGPFVHTCSWKAPCTAHRPAQQTAAHLLDEADPKERWADPLPPGAAKGKPKLNQCSHIDMKGAGLRVSTVDQNGQTYHRLQKGPTEFVCSFQGTEVLHNHCVGRIETTVLSNYVVCGIALASSSAIQSFIVVVPDKSDHPCKMSGSGRKMCSCICYFWTWLVRFLIIELLFSVSPVGSECCINWHCGVSRTLQFHTNVLLIQ